MTEVFDRYGSLVVVRATISGPRSTSVVALAVDTAAARSVIDPDILASIGYDITSPIRSVPIISATNRAVWPLFTLARIEVLSRTRARFMIAGVALPDGVTVDGLLGIDFMRGLDLAISFRRGQISLE